jgi:hypothetical protein
MAKQPAKEQGTAVVNFRDHRTKAIFDFMAKAEKKTNRQFLDFLVWEYFKQNYANKGPGKESSRKKPGRRPGRKPGSRKTKAITGEEKAGAVAST